MWDLKQLRADVKRCFGSDQVRLIDPCLRSIDDRRGFARYHYSEANGLMDGEIVGRKEPELFAAMMGAYDRDPGDFEWARFRAAAHITACVQCMHAMADILAHTVYFGLGMNLDRATTIKPKAINIETVRDKIPSIAIKDQMHAFTDHPEYIYLSALNNHSKHRSIVAVGFSVDFEEATHGLRFSAFEYGSAVYPQRWVKSTLEAEYGRQETYVHGIGHALNADLAARP